MCIVIKMHLEEQTHRRGFFLGPGFPLGLGVLSPEPLAAAADRLTPFFFAPSAGGPMAESAGVPSATGVAALESEAFSPVEAGGAAAGVPEVAGDSFVSSCNSLTGTSLSTESGSSSSRSRAGDTVRVTSNVGLEPDFRRPSAVLMPGTMAA